jgi:hypothetical protein
MGIWIKWIPEQEDQWKRWVKARPKVIRDLIKKHNFRFDRLYLLKTTGQRVTLFAFWDDGTVQVDVRAKFNQHIAAFRILGSLNERRVFNIKPEDLEECDWDGEVQDGAKLWAEAQEDKTAKRYKGL